MKTQSYTTMEELYTDNSRLVYSFAFDYVRNADEAEELAGHIWLKVFENRDKFKNKGRAEVRNYIRIMTRNLAADYAQKRHKESRMNSELNTFTKRESPMYVMKGKNILLQQYLCSACRKRSLYILNITADSKAGR